ncbi:hypothetical protein D3C73_1156300 [compost metagenome]
MPSDAVRLAAFGALSEKTGTRLVTGGRAMTRAAPKRTMTFSIGSIDRFSDGRMSS